MNRAYLALGGNLGDRRANLAAALRRLAASDGLRVLRTAGVIETEPVGVREQPRFLNTVCEVETTLRPRELLSRCQEIEKELGRDRTQETVRWGPRVIDLDIVLYGEERLAEPGLTIPHPELARRRFVLAPLAELTGDRVVPGTGKTVAELLAACEEPT